MTSTVFRAGYRLTLYAPRSEQTDPTHEVDLLYPRAGALHADPFQVWTLPTAGAWKGYLLPPKGRRSALSLRERKADAGSLVADLLDKRLGSANDARWLTQYFSSTSGEARLHQCLGVWEETLDGGATWTPYFTGRVKATRQVGPQLWRLEFRDLVEDWKRDIFVGPPASAVSAYANGTALVPHHNVTDYHNIFARPWVPATIRATATGADGTLRFNPSAPYDRWCIVSKALSEQAADVATVNLTVVSLALLTFTPGVLRARVRNPATLATGTFDVTLIRGRYDKVHAIASDVELQELDPAAAGSATWASLGSVGDALEVMLYATGPLGGQHAILINDVHPVQLLADLCDGYYGRLQDDGTPMFGIRRDATSAVWASMIADPSWGTVSFIVQEQARFSDWVQERLCKPLGLAIVPDAAGYLVPVDLRAGPVSGLATITDADVVADESDHEWTQDVGGAVNFVRYDYWGDFAQTDLVPSRDQAAFPDSRPGLIQSVPQSVIAPGRQANLIDLGIRPLTVKAEGLRYSPDYVSIGQSANATAARGRAQRLANEWLAAYARGARTLSLTCRRTAVPAATYPGDLVLVDVSTVLSPDTLTYGAVVQARCTSREESGATIVLGLELMAITAVADPPTIDTPVLQTPSASGMTISAWITVNAAGEPGEAMYIVTADTVAVRPADADPGWTGVAVFFSTGNAWWFSLPFGKRAWVRARTRPQLAGGFKQPSAWVYPAGTGYVDTTALTAPTGVAVTDITQQTARVSWSGGGDGWAYQILQHVGTDLVTWTDAEVIATLQQPPREYLIGGNTDGVTYSVGVRFIDPTGAPGPIAAVSYTAGGAVATAPRLAGMSILYWSHVELTVYPGDTSYDIEVERAPDLAGAPDTANSVLFLIPRDGYFFDYQLPDYTTWWYRARHRLDVAGVTPGPWLAWVATQARPRQGTGGGDGTPNPPWTDPALSVQPTPIAPVLPTVSVAQSAAGGTGTCTVTVTDPQQRVTAVEFQTFDGSTTSAWTADATAPYEATVAYGASAISVIRYRLIGYDAAGTAGATLVQGEVYFGAPAVAHAVTHQNGGVDELSVAGLSGVLADAQNAAWLNGNPVLAPLPTDGDALTWDAVAGAWVAAAPSGGGGGARPIGCCFDGSGSAVALTGSTQMTVTAPVNGTLTSWRMTTVGGPGSCRIKVRKSTYSGFPGSLADITGGADCVLSSADKAEDTTLSGWTTALTAGDVLVFTLVSAATVTSVTLLLTYIPT